MSFAFRQSFRQYSEMAQEGACNFLVFKKVIPRVKGGKPKTQKLLCNLHEQFDSRVFMRRGVYAAFMHHIKHVRTWVLSHLEFQSEALQADRVGAARIGETKGARLFRTEKKSF